MSRTAAATASDAVNTQGAYLGYKTSSSGTATRLYDMQNYPDMGGSKDKNEITTFDHTAHVYKDGLDNYGDSLDFTFLYTTEQFGTLEALDTELIWVLTFSDGATCTFSGTPHVRMNSGAVNGIMTYTLSITPSSAMAWA